MTPAERTAAFRELARGLDRIDVDVYHEYGLDPLEPVIGGGERGLALGVFGRDPGRHEIRHRQPFVGAGGQKVRKCLYRAAHGAEMPDFAASLTIGQRAFWANTVPYKPIGNKAWGMRTKRDFAPIVRDLLVHGWSGQDLLCLGRVAFDWFALGDKAVKAALKEHWDREDRFDASIEAPVTAPDGASRVIRLHPLPHPSPLNATWAPHFERLTMAALQRIGWAG